MSRTVTHYVNGRPQYRDDGPAYARRAGWGGSALGHFSQTVLTHAQRKAAGKADAEAAKRHRRSVTP